MTINTDRSDVEAGALVGLTPAICLQRLAICRPDLLPPIRTMLQAGHTPAEIRQLVLDAGGSAYIARLAAGAATTHLHNPGDPNAN